MIKLVVTDMDGTFLRPDLSVSKNNLVAVKELNQHGVHFAIATGRPDQLMKEYVDKLGLKEPIIMSNGSIIGHPFQAQRVWEKTLSSSTLKALFQVLDKAEMDYLIYTKEAIITRDNERYRFFQQRNETLPKHQRAEFIVTEQPSYSLNDKKAYKVLVLENNAQKYKKYFNLFSSWEDVEVYQSQKTFIDINPQGISKGNAIIQLANYYGIDVKDVVVFGDQHNDLEMMKTAGIAVAMGNAIEEVKQVADFITTTNEEDGFARWINDHILHSN